MRREQGLRERPFGGFEELQKGRGEPGGLNTKERLSKGEGLGGAWCRGSACRKDWILAVVPEECREFICARHSSGLARLRKRLSEPQPCFLPWAQDKDTTLALPQGPAGPSPPTGLVFHVSQH
ncbi:hypothetical protein PAL_GLEAN10009971 [Pteropus alecto]|uniref:Uncharacterized protein n=1 Tax=Pteropus alecto TaxID=9402 RepID=L5KA44_PTEAL|nr:hypothetical protein PAL_GLEAN10009971 [Pteropus alecto]